MVTRVPARLESRRDVRSLRRAAIEISRGESCFCKLDKTRQNCDDFSYFIRLCRTVIFIFYMCNFIFLLDTCIIVW